MPINRGVPVNYGISTQWASLNVMFVRFLMTCKNIYDKTLKRAG